MLQLAQRGPSPSARSLRRWLLELSQEGLLVREGDRKGALYRLKGSRQHADFSPISQDVIRELQKPLFERLPVPYHEEWLRSYQPNRTRYLPEATTQQLRKAGERLRHQDPARTYAHQIFRRLLVDLSYNSSRLEGNTYSRLDTERLLLEGMGAEGKLDEEKIMILNHKEAIRYLVDQAPNLQISPDTICTMHFLLADSLVEPHLAGRIRDHGVRVGGSVYPPYENTTKIRELLHEITEKASQIQDPFEQSLFLLAHISYLQAFSDVNNRTARLCANIPLVIHNLVPISFIDIERSDYLSAILAIYELQEIRPLADLYIQSYFRTCALYDAHTASMGFDEVRVRYRAHRRACLREIILACMDPKMVHLFAKQHALTLPVEVQTAFIQDVLEDLDLMDNVRMVGLGISLQDLQKWQLAYSQPPR